MSTEKETKLNKKIAIALKKLEAQNKEEINPSIQFKNNWMIDVLNDLLKTVNTL